MVARKVLPVLSVAAVCCSVGCSIEHSPSRRELAQQSRTETPSHYAPPPRPHPIVDDAARVAEACGAPARDTVQAIYDKEHNGPVRRMVYFNRQAIVMEYIPSLPVARQTSLQAPFPPEERASPTPPPGSVWRFQVARVGEREFLTSTRLSIYLPCAARALADEL